MPFPGIAVKALPEKWRGCGNCALPFSATGGGRLQFLLAADGSEDQDPHHVKLSNETRFAGLSFEGMQPEAHVLGKTDRTVFRLRAKTLRGFLL